ncbi:hypothetical protein GO730_00465 [Spirosoma sp. HMF3257]|uniref:Uncharacterized protein n=1 Tax=Spirosoma telluris TaxID=2183553 RepID=A0A327NH45_9BACT|nr:hypothetical protein [Spirosoma telluris]RAI73276.1 hypothetical protein HMF3257_00455 [Spirosoma telluris]
MIIKSIDDLKLFLGRAINQATTLAFIQPFIQLAEDEFIRPTIGDEMLNELDTQYNSSAPNALTPNNRLLLTKLQRALAFYTYTKYLPFSLGNDGDNGLQEQSTDKTQPVRIGVLDKRQRESAENAATALETALLFLQRTKANYPTWTASDAFKRANALFIYSGSELTDNLPQAAGSYRLFLSLIPYLHMTENQQIKPLIGSAQFDDLKAKRIQTTALQPVDIRLMEAVSKATATCAYARALYYLNVVQTSGGGLRILSDFDGIYNQKAVDAKLLQDAQSKADTEAAASLNALKSYLTSYADQYPLYKNSDRYQAAGPNEFPDNSTYKGIFRMR